MALTRKQIDDRLQEACVQYANDPLGFTMFMYDWGHGDLRDETGPDEWQKDVLNELGAYCLKLRNHLTAKKVGTADALARFPNPGPFQLAVASGHGIGKSALVSWIVLWFMSCKPDPQIRVTANTEVQLNTTTWRELAVWHGRIHTKDWFTWTATKFYLNAAPEKWYASAVAWSDNNPEAFAGVHEKNMLYLFDEASKIADVIWEKADGAMSTFGSMWLCFGNPTRNVGRFYDAFHKDRRFWITRQVDSRTAKKVDKVWVQTFIDRLGLTDDRTRYQILGQFPSAATRQLISTDAVERAMSHQAEPESYQFLPVVLGIDIARFGENSSVIAKKQGRKIFPLEVLRKMDLMQTAHHIAERIRAEKPTQVFIDESGIGAGVVDRLRQLNFSVTGINGGNQSTNPRFLNRRAEIWWEMKEFIEGLCELPNDQKLKEELTCLEYDFTDKGRIRLDRKTDIMETYGFSPDRADALALCLSYPVADYNDDGMILEPPAYAD